MCKIAILEQFTLLGSGIKSILHEDNKYDIVVEGQSTEKMFSILGETVPDIIIIDIIHCDNSGVKPLKKVRRKYPKVPVLIIVSEEYADCFEEFIRLGVKGFVFNTSDEKEFLAAMKKLKNGEEYFSNKVWNIFKESIQLQKQHKNVDQRLSDREVLVLKLFSNGLTYKEIGAQLNISPRTVETHKRNILSKLKIHTTADMVKYAYRHNILT